MKIKTTIAAFILLVAPAAAFAAGAGCQGADHAKEEITMSCSEGMTFDADTNTCVAETIG